MTSAEFAALFELLAVAGLAAVVVVVAYILIESL